MSIFITLGAPYNRKELQELNSELACYGIKSYDFDFHRQYDYDLLPWIQLLSYDRKLIHRLKTIAIELEYNPSWTPNDSSLFVDQPIFMDLVIDKTKTGLFPACSLPCTGLRLTK